MGDKDNARLEHATISITTDLHGAIFAANRFGLLGYEVRSIGPRSAEERVKVGVRRLTDEQMGRLREKTLQRIMLDLGLT